MKGKSGKHHKTYLKTPKAEVEERSIEFNHVLHHFHDFV